MITSLLGRVPLLRRNRKKLITKVQSTLTSLPKELLTEVLAQVASTSVIDLGNVKLSCKELCKAAEDDYIYAHASMDKFSIAWPISDRGAYIFLKRCEKSGNTDYLFRQGMFEYFSTRCTDSGLKLLKRAAEKNHADAIYVYSIILLCSSSGKLKQKGLKLLSSLKIYRITECRKRIKRVIWKLWIRNVIEQEENGNIKTCACVNRKTNVWLGDDEIVAGCDSCLCAGEITFFCDLLRSEFIL